MNKQYRKHGLILLGVILIICSISFFAFHKDAKVEEVSQKAKTKMHVYLLHEDMLIQYPTITDAKKREDKIKEIVHYLTQNAGPFEALLKEDTQFHKVTIDKNIATLDFGVLNYEKKNERRLIESLIYSCTQFSNIDEIAIQVKGKKLLNLPLNNTPLLNTNQKFGINHVDTNQLYLHKGNETVLYFKRIIEGKTYAVPRSIRLQHIDDYNEVMQVILGIPNVASALQQPLANKKVLMEKEAKFEDGILHLYLNKNILATKKNLDVQCEEHLRLNFKGFPTIQVLKIHVDTKTYDIIVKK